jgi:hypothetical protein
MFYEIQPGKHINLKDISYFYINQDNDIYSKSIRFYFRDREHIFQFNDSLSCKQAYDKLVAKIYSMNNPSHIKTIMD